MCLGYRWGDDDDDDNDDDDDDNEEEEEAVPFFFEEHLLGSRDVEGRKQKTKKRKGRKEEP